jgi:hypothetical protein
VVRLLASLQHHGPATQLVHEPHGSSVTEGLSQMMLLQD